MPDSVPAADGDLLHSGWLERARMGTVFNKRWFELYDEPSLYYYEDETKAKIRGMVRLSEATLLIAGEKLQLVATDNKGNSSTLKLKAASPDEAHDWGLRIKSAIENAPPEMDPETAAFMKEHGNDMAPQFTNQAISTGAMELGSTKSPPKGRSGRRGSAQMAAEALAKAKLQTRGSVASIDDEDDQVITSISDDEDEEGKSNVAGLHDEIKKGKKLKAVKELHQADDSANWEVLVQGSLLREIMGGGGPKKLKKVAVREGENDGGVKSEAMVRGGLMNEIAKGKELKKTNSSADGMERSQTMARAGLLNEINKIRKKEEEAAAAKAAASVDEGAKSALLAGIQQGATLKQVVVEGDKNNGAVKDEMLLRGGLMNEIAKGATLNKVKEDESGSGDARVHVMVRGALLNQIISAKNQQALKRVPKRGSMEVSDAMVARGGLLNEIQKTGKAKEEAGAVAAAKEEHKSAATDLHAELLQGATLKPVAVEEGKNSGGVAEQVMARGGLLNEIAKGKELTKVDSAAGLGGPSEEVMARGGLMNEIAKGLDLKPVPARHIAGHGVNEVTLARAGLLNEINKKRTDNEEEEEKVARALHEAQSGDLIAAIQQGLTLKNVRDAADGGVNVELVLRGGLMFEIANSDASKLHHVEVEDGVKDEALQQAGLLNEIGRAGASKLKHVPVTQQARENTEMLRRGGLLNEIQKTGKAKEEATAIAVGKEEHKTAATAMHAELKKGASSLNKVDAGALGGPSEEVMARGGLLNEIAKGKELTKVDSTAGLGGPSEEVMARGGLMNEIAKGKDLKYIHDDRKHHRDAANPEALKE